MRPGLGTGWWQRGWWGPCWWGSPCRRGGGVRFDGIEEDGRAIAVAGAPPISFRPVLQLRDSIDEDRGRMDRPPAASQPRTRRRTSGVVSVLTVGAEAVDKALLQIR